MMKRGAGSVGVRERFVRAISLRLGVGGRRGGVGVGDGVGVVLGASGVARGVGGGAAWPDAMRAARIAAAGARSL
jgi:hypothetical protein